MHWQYTTSTSPTDLKQLTDLLLSHRGVKSQSQKEAFFHPKHPVELTLEEVGISAEHMDMAVRRIQQAKERNEEVVIFGDYDADGICSTAILWEALRSIGVIAKPFLPHREKHGYGLTLRSLASVLEEHKPQLLITVDNGIVAHAAFAELQRLGIDTILTDHHAPEAELPVAQVVIHTTKLCGSGVAWFLARHLSETSAQASLDLAAIATIADQMVLLDANRSFVVHGMAELRQTERIGLQLLMAKANVLPEKISADTINYVIAPRLNAMGRLKHSLDALRLVCTTSYDRAHQLVAELNDTNVTRQELTTEMIEHAISQAERWENEHIIIVASEDYHEGVIGLLASKLVEEYFKPAIAISIGQKTAKASARSIMGVNITELIRQVKDDLLEAGGHPMAAGFAADPAKLTVVQQRLQVLAKAQITAEMLTPRLLVEVGLPIELVTLSTAEEIAHFSPFGQGNPEPIISLPPAVIHMASQVGKEGKHLRLQVGLQKEGTQITLTCLAWGKGSLATELPVGTQVELAGCLSVNEWKNKRSLQMVVRDIHLIESEPVLRS
ncbi:single-stranded-DNA-specific exonuclease RecJ [Patescibacteria group bacterium]|nr:single-stranded-DNA-specific exonuclease RecJ [Patescibacteria group bacterium]